MAANFDGLEYADVSNHVLSFSFGTGDVPVADLDALDAIKTCIAQRVAEGKKPAATLQKQLDRIADHRAQLADAITKLFSAYARMTAEVPYQRGSVAAKARRDMLASMTDDVLRRFAKIHIDTDDYILPDDRAALEVAVLKAMSTVQVEA